MIDALALLITGREFWIGFIAGGVLVGFGVLAICRAKFYDVGYDHGWRDGQKYIDKPRVHNW